MDRQRKNELEQLYEKYAKSLYYFLLKMSGSVHIAEDLVQETFVRATISLSFYKEEDVRAWLFKVARNTYLDEWRKQKRRRTIPFAHLFWKDELLSPYGLPEADILMQEVTEDIQSLFNFLPENYRMILYLREYEQFTYHELQEALDLSEGQVKVLLHRARKRLAEIAKKNGGLQDD
ncbi:sigma-70 family RNA polymerase sigma factor [Lysinibacillus sp. NPDC097231]|uniref:sigma-70 family RNA polymerase sigma factor n=1 Tax=Lysinibacillus sp. NPDC097231 TaxID=3364142 RepID=UPI0037F8B0E1